MKNVFQPKDLIGLDDVRDRGDVAIWVDKSFAGSKIMSYDCSACGCYAVSYPTAYCPDCGSLMLNFPIAFNTFKKAIDCVKAERKGKRNDVSAD